MSLGSDFMYLVFYAGAIGIATGLWAMWVAELRALERPRREIVMSVAVASTLGYGWAAGAFGWWTPGSWGRELGLIDSDSDAMAVSVIVVVSAVLTMLVVAVVQRWRREVPCSDRPDQVADDPSDRTLRAA